MVAAGVGAFLFAVHPIHVEVVANVSGRKDLLAAIFVLGMALSHRRILARSAGWIGVPVAFYVCAMLSKEVGVAALLLVAAQDVFLENDRVAFFKRRRVVGTYVTYVGALVARNLLLVGFAAWVAVRSLQPGSRERC